MMSLSQRLRGEREFGSFYVPDVQEVLKAIKDLGGHTHIAHIESAIPPPREGLRTSVGVSYMLNLQNKGLVLMDGICVNVSITFKGLAELANEQMENVRERILDLLKQNGYKPMKQGEIIKEIGEDFPEYSLIDLHIAYEQMERNGEILREEPTFPSLFDFEVIVKPTL
ncbi:MAG: hypothetical protein ABEK59_02165 [Halobacteria archaeon]